VTCLSGYMFYNETCIVTCPSGYFGSEGVGGCRKCSEECASCILNETTCLNCATGFLYYQRTCLVTCPKQTYQAGGNCIACKYPCLECVSDSRCVSCQNGALDGNTSTCLSACPSKYYPTGVDGVDSLVCVACDEECSECAGQPKNCTQCVGSKFLFGNGCVAVCPDMYFGDAQVNACFSCLTPCLYCTDQVSCTKCADEYVYMSSINQCLLACPNGFFQILNPSQGHTDSKYICQSCKP
jgi:proprotein convertase subtilisin/kexin type 5